ncbi:hypothetical protein QO001_006036 [Methylobacterium brachiatum]|uniref:Uncharacterized protein n=2 Tax=Methylobacterium brachiatum TaxID=269660 RepID=A0AAJ1TTV8_9HYPH|nr:hypothetical protein [Methylobacterium brachiatum]MCB4805810.1 hypothetical protein [Methylobacterium brachiatum]MDQ0547081.1 hypothetical protein [Methylobacterium brachiatum]
MDGVAISNPPKRFEVEMADDLTPDEKRAINEEARLKVARMQKTWAQQIRSFKVRAQLLADGGNLSPRGRYEASAYIAALDLADEKLSQIAGSLAGGEVTDGETPIAAALN